MPETIDNTKMKQINRVKTVMKKHIDDLMEDDVYKLTIRGIKNRPKLAILRKESENYRKICERFLGYKMLLDNNPGPAEHAKEFYLKNPEYSMPKTLLAEENAKKMNFNENKIINKVGKANLER